MSSLYAIHHDGGSATAANATEIASVNKPMSIKDRIRAMNLIAEKSFSNSSSSSSSSSSNNNNNNNSSSVGCVTSSRSKFSNHISPRQSNQGIAFDLVTLDHRNDERERQRKPTGLSSDPGVGNDKEAATKAINKWRIRRGEDMTKRSVGETNNDMDDDRDKIEWTIFDLTKGSTCRRITGSSPSPVPSLDNHDAIDNKSSKVTGSKSGVPSLNSMTPTPPVENIQSGKKSPTIIPQINSFHRRSKSTGSDFGFVMPKLKPVRRAPRTLELINKLTISEPKVDSRHNIHTEKNSQYSENTIFDEEKKDCAPSHNWKKVEHKSIPRDVNRHVRGNIGSLKQTVMSHHGTIGMNSIPGENSTSTKSEMETVDHNFHVKVIQNDAATNMKKKVGTPQRSKISDRIKAFSSAANGSNWKYQSPARNNVLPPSSSSAASSIKKIIISRDRQNQGEDSSCASSEKQSVDDDSISVSTPMANSTPARLGAQPPTPNSYNSEAAYTSVASSGDGAVAGSFASSEQNQSTQLLYTHVSTPGSSVQDDNSTSSPQHGDIVVTKPGMKNSLQSKLEYDKQRAARRLRMSKKRMKVPSVLVAAQKKAQDEESTPKWGAGRKSNESTPQRAHSTDPDYLNVSVPSLDEDPTIQEQTLHEIQANCNEQFQKDTSLDEDPTIQEQTFHEIKTNRSEQVPIDRSPIGTKSVEKKCSLPVESAPEKKYFPSVEGTPKLRHDDSAVKSGQMKAEVMKQLINKRRRRRKASLSATRESIVDKKIPVDSKDQSVIKNAHEKEIPGLHCIEKNMSPKTATGESNITSVKSEEKVEGGVDSHSVKAHTIQIVDAKHTSTSKQSPTVLSSDETKESQVSSSPAILGTTCDAMGSDDKLLINQRVDANDNKTLGTKVEDENLSCSKNCSTNDRSIPTQFDDKLSDASKYSRSVSPALERSAGHMLQLHSSGVSCAPPLPPDIIRSTQKEEEQETKPIHSRNNATNEKGNTVKPDVLRPNADTAPDSPSNSVSVASSLFQDYPDDEDEPEPVVESFIDMELSPIRTQDMSKHDFDTSTSYRGSPDSHLTSFSNFTEQHSGLPKPIRDSTPRRANRHITNKRIEKCLNSPVFAQNTNCARSTRSRNLSLILRDSNHGSTSEHEIAENTTSSKLCTSNPEIKSPIDESYHLSQSHCDDDIFDSCSDIRISPASSATSSAVSAMASRANKLLSVRRNKSKKRIETESSVQESHAIDLARKIMKDTQKGNVDVSTGSVSKNPLHDDQEKESEVSETIVSTDTSKLEATRDNNAVSSFKSETTRGSSYVLKRENNSHDYTSSDLDMDVDTIYSILDQEESTTPNAHFTCFSMACCNQNVDISDSLNFSTMSAVRISQDTAGDVPFDEETAAIEVEYISNENIASVSRSQDGHSNILMHVSSALRDDDGKHFTFMPNLSLTGKDRQTLHYISESSDDISDDMVYPTQISSKYV